MTIEVGDIVRFKPELQNRLQLHVEDVCGEVVAVGKLTARVTWDDGREHSSLLSNLQLAKPPASTWNSEHIDGIAEQRAKLLVSASADLKEAWADGAPEKWNKENKKRK